MPHHHHMQILCWCLWFMQLYELKTYLVLLSVSQLAILKERTRMPRP